MPTVTISVLWALLALYALAHVLQIHPGPLTVAIIMALHVLPAAAFALIHGAALYRWRIICVFIAIMLVVGNIFENIGVHSGFPYGHYYFTSLMGPRLFAVPVLLGLAYVGMSYVSWILACLILQESHRALHGSRVIVLPLTAAFIMVAWDLSQEPVWATLVHLWVFPRGGAYFGVPLTNFLGWYLAVYVIYQSFALLLWKSGRVPLRRSAGFWRLAVLLYAISAAGNLLPLLARTGGSVAYDAARYPWRVHDIVVASALISIFVMGAFVLIAWARSSEVAAEPASPVAKATASADK